MNSNSNAVVLFTDLFPVCSACTYNIGILCFYHTACPHSHIISNLEDNGHIATMGSCETVKCGIMRKRKEFGIRNFHVLECKSKPFPCHSTHVYAACYLGD